MVRRVLLALAGVFLFTTLAACAPRTYAEKLMSLASKTRVCVDNPSFHGMRVEILDSYSGHEYGELSVRSGQFECEWMQVTGTTLDARIKSVSVVPDVIPPAWKGMMAPKRGTTMELVVGADGITPFAHSSRRR